MALKIAIMNQKGGVGKSSTVYCLTDKLRKKGRVLVLDLDQQNNQRTLLGVKERLFKEISAAGILVNGISPKEAIINVTENVDLIHSGGTAIESFDRFSKMEGSGATSTRLARALSAIEDDYDFIIMDSSPTMTLIHQNIVCYADYILIPCDMDILSFSALKSILRFLESLKSKISEVKAEVLGIIPYRYNKRRIVDSQVRDDLCELEDTDLLLGGKVLTPVRESSNVKTAQARRKFLSDAFPQSPISEDFDQITLEILNEVEKRNNQNFSYQKESGSSEISL